MRKVPMKTKGGNLAKNQIRVFDTDGTHFYSYGKKVATFRSFSSPSVILYAPWWDMYSQTTNNYLLQFFLSPLQTLSSDKNHNKFQFTVSGKLQFLLVIDSENSSGPRFWVGI